MLIALIDFDAQSYSTRALQSYSKRIANAKSDKYHNNIHKRGKVWDGKEVRSSLRFYRGSEILKSICLVCLLLHAGTSVDRNLASTLGASGSIFHSDVFLSCLCSQKSKSSVSAGPWLLGFFAFVLVGSGKSC